MPRKKPEQRRGVAAVEFALVAPLFILLLFGIIEFGHGMMVQQVMTNASRAGAREAALPDSTVESVKRVVAVSLSVSSIDVAPNDITVSPNPATAFHNEQITVAVEVPYSQVSWLPASYLAGKKLRASTKMRSERLQ